MRFSFSLCVLALAACATLRGNPPITPPTITFEKATYRAVDFDALHLDIAFVVTNPNRFSGHVESYDLELIVDKVTIADGTVDQPADLTAGGSTTVVVPVVLRWVDVAQRLNARGGVPDDMPWHLEGKARLKVDDRETTLPFAADGTLPVIRRPNIRIVGLHADKASLAKVSLGIDLEMGTPGLHALSIGELDYTIALSGQTVVSGELPPIGPVPGTLQRTLTADVSPLQVGTVLIGALQNKKPIDVHITGRTMIDTGYGVAPYELDVHSVLPPN